MSFASRANPRRVLSTFPQHIKTRLSARYIHLLRDLPTPSLERLLKRPKLVPCELIEAESSERYSPTQQLSKWTTPPETLLLVQKPNDAPTSAAMGLLLKHLKRHHPNLRLIIEPHTAKDHPELTSDCILCQPGDEGLLSLHSNMVITLGGDGTILHVSHLFGEGECPPVLSFSMGSLGFLLPFHIDSMGKTLETTLDGPVSLLNRMRLACMPITREGTALACAKPVGDAGWQVMNEVTLHRGRHPHLTVVDAYFDNQHLTEAVADGLLLSTPTGSTAYSLSAGGPISHPETDAFLLTPIAPRSLSFRTVVLPGRGTVQLKISDIARAPAELSVDGREVCMLNSGESVIIKKSPFPIPCVVRGEGGGGWARDINSLLQFNTSFKNSAHLAHTMS